jgi:hypothetical protein
MATRIAFDKGSKERGVQLASLIARSRHATWPLESHVPRGPAEEECSRLHRLPKHMIFHSMSTPRAPCCSALPQSAEVSSRGTTFTASWIPACHMATRIAFDKGSKERGVQLASLIARSLHATWPFEVQVPREAEEEQCSLLH